MRPSGFGKLPWWAAFLTACALIVIGAGYAHAGASATTQAGASGVDGALRAAESTVRRGAPLVAERHLRRARIQLRREGATPLRLMRLARIGHLHQRHLLARIGRTDRARTRTQLRRSFQREIKARRADGAHVADVPSARALRAQAGRSLRAWRAVTPRPHLRALKRSAMRAERAHIAQIAKRERALRRRAEKETAAPPPHRPTGGEDPAPPVNPGPPAKPGPPANPGSPERPIAPPNGPDRRDGEETESAPHPPSGPVRALQGVRYAAQHNLALDALLPAAPHAAVVLVHGGAWRGGERADMALIGAHLADAGYATFAVDYRKHVEPLFPAQYEDVGRAVAWVRAHAEQFNLRERPVVLLGASAGGHIALMVALGRYAHVDAAIGWSAPVDLVRLATDRDARPGCSSPQMCATPAWFADQLPGIMGCAFSRDQTLLGLGFPAPCPSFYRENSPGMLAEPALLPTLLVHAPGDPLVAIAPARDLVARLRGLGVPAKLAEHPGEGHANQLHALAIGDTVRFLAALTTS